MRKESNPGVYYKIDQLYNFNNFTAAGPFDGFSILFVSLKPERQ